jgi:malonyl CoA-acyl carrier protein transacylase
MLAGVQKEFPAIAGEYFAGHSLGEYTALVAAGVIPFAEAVKIVRKRGALMQKAVPVGEGAMAALIADNIDTLDIASVVKGAGAEVANFNSKTQIVISGKAPAVAAASAQLKEKFPTMNIIQLNVSAPFHSSLMRNIEPEFEAFLKGLLPTFNLAKAPKVLSNYSGTFHTADTLLKNIVSQISGSVDWLANMRAVGGVSNDIIEVGPARVLTKFFATLDMTARAVTDVRSMKKNLTPA